MIRGKKVMIAAAAVMMALCMTGCGGSGDDGQDVQTVPQTQASQNAQDQQTDQGNGAAQNGNYGQGSSHHGNGSGQNGVTDIGMDQAMAIAVARIQGATVDNVMEIERDVDDGRIEYEGSIWYGGYEYEFEIDGSTGNILKWEIDD